MMRKNQKGFTLIELIIAVAILAIVTLAVCGFIVVGSRSYTSANTDIMLQQEAQLALNQISDVIIDTTDSISYSVGTEAGMQNVLKDSEYGGEATDKCLVVVNRNDTDSNNNNPSYWFYWNKDEETIYFNEVPGVNSTMSADEIQAGFVDADNGKAVLAEHVTDLSIDISQFEENRVVMVGMTLQNGNREYSTSNNVTVRNRIALNIVDIEPMQRAPEFRIKNMSSVMLEPGDDYKFDPEVETSSSSTALKWELIGAGAGTTLDNDGNLHVGIEEATSNFNVRVSRAEEDYIGQNDRVAVTVRVTVKRVDSVDLVRDASVTKIKAGDTIVINGSAAGRHLGELCSSINCQTDDRSKDHDVTNWKTTPESASATIVSSNAKSATIKLGDDLKKGDIVIIEATSVLSENKNGGYSSDADTNKSSPGVQGIIRLTVDEGVKGDLKPLGGDIRYGSDNDMKVGMTYNPLYEGMSDFNHYVVCARLREVGSNNKDNDEVILYYGDGKDIRFKPDLFGTDISKDYYVFLQLILPVDKSLYENVPGVEAIHLQNQDDTKNNPQAIVDEYFAHLDSNGAYIGTKYEASAQYSGGIGKPVFYYELHSNDKMYPNHDTDDAEKYYLANGSNTVLSGAKLDTGNIINFDSVNMNINGMIKVSVYEGEGSNIDNWKLVGGYYTKYDSGRGEYRADDYDTESGGYIKSDGSYSEFAEGMFSSFAGTNGTQELTGGPDNPLVKKNNSNVSWKDAAGTYHIVLGFRYACNRKGSTNYNIIYEDCKGDFNEHYYSNWDGALTLKIESGLNLEVRSSKEGNFKTFFPVPSDQQFPFALKSSATQSTTWNFAKYNDSEQKIGDLNNIKVECEFYSDDNSYTITLSSDSVSGKTVTTHIYGKYKCRYGGDKWELQSGESDKTETIVPNLFGIDRYGTNYEAYFPLPSDSDFPFKKESPQAQTILQQLILFDQWNNGQTITAEITCEYSSGVYTISVKQYENEWYKIDFGQWTWKTGDTQWTKK